MYLILNAYWEPLDFELPPVGDGGAGPWRRWIDTALESPQDIVPWQTAPVAVRQYLSGGGATPSSSCCSARSALGKLLIRSSPRRHSSI